MEKNCHWLKEYVPQPNTKGEKEYKPFDFKKDNPYWLEEYKEPKMTLEELENSLDKVQKSNDCNDNFRVDPESWLRYYDDILKEQKQPTLEKNSNPIQKIKNIFTSFFKI